MPTKFDIHVHTNLDPREGKSAFNMITYSPEELFDKAQGLGYTALALTHHDKFVFSKSLSVQASKYGILLIPGVEAVVEGVDVIILNPKSRTNFNTFEHVKEEKTKNPDCFIFAPHPFYPAKYCLKNNLFEHMDLFDGIECSFLNYSVMNRYNKQAKLVANKYKKQFIATGDLHQLSFLGRSFSTMKKDVDTVQDFISALKTEHIHINNKKLSRYQFLSLNFFHAIGKIKKYSRKARNILLRV